jgi:hypothetical protein
VITCHLCIQLSEGDEAKEAEATNGLLCARHTDRLRIVLQDLDHWHHHVSQPEFLRSTKDRDTERWVGSRAPLDTGTLSVLDRRTRSLVPGDLVSPERVVRAWTYAIIDNCPLWDWSRVSEFSSSLPRPVSEFTLEVSVHLTSLAWIIGQPSVVRYARHMAACRRSLTKLIPSL